MSFLKSLQSNFKFVLFIFVCNGIFAIWLNYISYFSDSPLWFAEKCAKSFGMIFVIEMTLLLVGYFLLKIIGGGALYKQFLMLLSFLSFVLLLVEGFLLYTYNTPLTPYVIDAIMQSNLKESQEFLETFLNMRIVLISLCLLVVTFLYFKFFPAVSLEFSARFCNVFLGFFLLIVLIFLLDMGNRYHKGKDAFSKLKEFSLTRAIYSVAEFYGNHNFFYDYKQLVANYQNIRDSYSGKISANENSPTHIVLILGESTQRSFMSLYGFPLPTTPYLESLQDSGNLVVFSDMIANFAQTKLSLQNLLNFSNAGDKAWYQRLDMVNLFSLAGYKSAVFSNQEVVGSEVQSIAAISAFADYKSSANRLLTSSRIAESQIGYDGILLPSIKEFHTQNKESKTFNIIHLMGTHNTYSKRYPQEFARFSKEDLTYPNSLDSSQKQVVATYLNALLYNDYILNAIYEIYQNEDAILLYVSDHGESLYQHQGKLGHFFTTRFNAEIPFIALVSETFKQKHPKTLESLQKAKDKPFMLDDLIHTLTNVAQIEVVDYDSSKDILSDDFNAQRTRIFNLKADYDKDLKQEKDSSS